MKVNPCIPRRKRCRMQARCWSGKRLPLRCGDFYQYSVPRDFSPALKMRASKGYDGFGLED